ncbi:galactokinase [Streptomyces apocyni]|uniref:galactokinase n=1 Tax=Streptomyces apocyni TaxID=2654677 RepID=UPI0012E99429|nr:galactokinase [Streptomyces apocyni]
MTVDDTTQVTQATQVTQVTHVIEGFREVYGRAPDGVWAAPGRVNLIGEHTDYNDGFVLPFALPHTTLAAVAHREDGLLRLHSGSPDVPGAVVEVRLAELAPGREAGRTDGWADYPAGVMWALREAGHPVGGADLHFASTVPHGAGLSSSAALEVATALALNEVHGLDIPPRELAVLCRHAENAYVGAPTGIMDQMASACCTAGHALFLDTRDFSQRQVPFDLAAHGLRLLVVDTRVTHAHSSGEYGQRRAGCEAGAASLGVTALRDVPYAELPSALDRLDDAEIRRLVRHVVTENERVKRTIALLADTSSVRAIGPILTESHASLRDDFRVSCAELDLVVDTALAAGALGARMTGGGFGGSAIVLADESAVRPLTAALDKAFTTAGLPAPRVFPALPSRGAHRMA